MSDHFADPDYVSPLHMLRGKDHDQLKRILEPNSYFIETNGHGDDVLLVFISKPSGNRLLMWQIYASQNKRQY